eukprot:SAG31_NODE_2944_length_4874_cov_30.998953_6_plen_157_part_00
MYVCGCGQIHYASNTTYRNRGAWKVHNATIKDFPTDFQFRGGAGVGLGTYTEGNWNPAPVALPVKPWLKYRSFSSSRVVCAVSLLPAGWTCSHHGPHGVVGLGILSQHYWVVRRSDRRGSALVIRQFLRLRRLLRARRNRHFACECNCMVGLGHTK